MYKKIIVKFLMCLCLFSIKVFAQKPDISVMINKGHVFCFTYNCLIEMSTFDTVDIIVTNHSKFTTISNITVAEAPPPGGIFPAAVSLSVIYAASDCDTAVLGFEGSCNLRISSIFVEPVPVIATIIGNNITIPIQYSIKVT